MQAIRSYTQSVSAIMALVMVLSSMWAIPASANIVGTGELLTEQRADVDREALMGMLEREDVKARWRAWALANRKCETEFKASPLLSLQTSNSSLPKRLLVKVW